MNFTLNVKTRPYIFIPYKHDSRSYFLYLYEHIESKQPLQAQPSDTLPDTTLFQFADLVTPVGDVVGAMIYTAHHTLHYGTSLVAYSMQWKRSLDLKRIPIRPFDLGLVSKSDRLLIYHRKNHVSMAVSPRVAESMRLNLEM